MNIVNTYSQLVCSGGGIAILWRGKFSVIGSQWSIYRINAKGCEIPTDPNTEWFNNGRKTFHVFTKTKKEHLEDAIKWVVENFPEYRDTPWVRNRLGDYVPKEINKKFPIRRN